jgi:TonB family protein
LDVRKVSLLVAAFALGCLFPQPPELSSFPARAGAAWSQGCCGKPVVRKAPVTPPEAARRSESGWVIVSGILDERGWVTDPVVLAADPPGVFDKAALEAFDGWRYAPAKSEAGMRREVRELLRFDAPRHAPGAMPGGGSGPTGGQPGY